MPLLIDLDDEEEDQFSGEALGTYPDHIDENSLDSLADQGDDESMLLEDHHEGIEPDITTLNLGGDDGEEEEDEDEDEDEDEIKSVRLGESGDDDTIIPGPLVKELDFVQVKLPSPEELVEDKEIQGKPHVFIGEFCIVVPDRYNIALYIWGASKVTRGRYAGQTITKFRPLGHFSSVLGALQAIKGHLDQCVISVANGRHLSDAIQYLERRDREFLSCIERINASAFTSGTVLRSTSLLSATSETMDPSSSPSSEPETETPSSKKEKGRSSSRKSTKTRSPQSSSQDRGGKRTTSSRPRTRSTKRSKSTGISSSGKKSKK